MNLDTLDTLDPARGLRQLARMFTLLDDRVDLIERDLPAGSLAAAIGDLRDELRDLRIIVEEHRRATA
jgi:hypothetical protein